MEIKFFIAAAFYIIYYFLVFAQDDKVEKGENRTTDEHY